MKRLINLRRLQAEGLSVTVYDRRSRPGGLWNYSEDPTTQFASAVYGDLQTNFPRHLMELQDYRWKDQPLIMPHHMVHQHLLGYAEYLFCLNNLCFQMDTEVVDLYYTRPSRAGTGYWRLISRSLVTGSMAFDEFAFVVIAVGVFEKPLVPYYAGLEAWKRVWPDSMSHAKSFRNPEAYRNKVGKTDYRIFVYSIVLVTQLNSTNSS
jgi:cation diffusion facilitator CzcD-associated flavoprotein CzcO